MGVLSGYVPGSPLRTWLQCWSLLYHKAQKNVVTWDRTQIPSMCVKWSSPTAKCKSWKEENRMTLGWKSKFFSQSCIKEEWSLLILNFFSTYRGKKKAQLGRSPLCSSVSLFLLLPGGEETSLPLVPLGEVSQLVPLQCILPVTAGCLKHLHACTLLQQKYSSLRCFASFRNEIRFYCPIENWCLGGIAIILISKLWLATVFYTIEQCSAKGEDL